MRSPRFAEREGDAAHDERISAKKNAYLLESFKYYAAAAIRSRNEYWPDNVCSGWRHDRASLAWILARESMMHRWRRPTPACSFARLCLLDRRNESERRMLAAAKPTRHFPALDDSAFTLSPAEEIRYIAKTAKLECKA